MPSKVLRCHSRKRPPDGGGSVGSVAMVVTFWVLSSPPTVFLLFVAGGEVEAALTSGWENSARW